MKEDKKSKTQELINDEGQEISSVCSETKDIKNVESKEAIENKPETVSTNQEATTPEISDKIECENQKKNSEENDNEGQCSEKAEKDTEIIVNKESTQEYIAELRETIKYSEELDKFFTKHFPYWLVGTKKDTEKYLRFLLLKKMKSLDTYEFELKNSIKQYLEKSNISSLLSMVKKVTPDELVGNPCVINTQSVQLNLKEPKFIVRLPKINDNFFKIGVKYDAMAQCPNWTNFIDEITVGNKDFAKFLQKIVGYSLTGSNAEQCIFILYGLGSNGKTMFIEMLKLLFGEYAIVVSKKLFQGRSKASDAELLNLIGKRMAILNELEAQTEIKTDFFKKLIGSDTIGFEAHKKHIEFRNKAKFFMVTNYLPVFSDYSKATTRRIKILPFKNNFEGQNRNLFLMEDLQKELSGILNWALEGYKLWEKEGLQEPEIIADFKRDYINQMDPLGFFLDESCDFDTQNTCISSTIFDEYNKWCAEQGIKAIARNKFGTELIMRGFPTIRLSGGARGYKGLKLKNALCITEACS